MAYSNSWSNGTKATSLDVVTSPNAGDVLIAYAVGDASGVTFTWPSGFTQLVRQEGAYDGMALGVAIKETATGSEGTLTIVGALEIIGGVVAFSGRDNASVEDFTRSVTNDNSGSGNGRFLDSNSVTPANNDCDFIAICGADTGSGINATYTFTTQSGTTGAWTNRADLYAANFHNVGVGTATQTTAGAVTVRCTLGLTGNSGQALVVIGLKSDGGGGGVVGPLLNGHLVGGGILTKGRLVG